MPTFWRRFAVVVIATATIVPLAHAQQQPPPAPTPASASPADVRRYVEDLAAALAKTEYRAPATVPSAAAINYTEYLGIRVKPGREIWGDRDAGFEVHPMPLGVLHVTPIELNLVERGKTTPLSTAGDFYEHSLPAEKRPPNGDLGVSGFRVTAPINSPRRMDEVLVFQGASYFRALSKGQVHGLSARAISVGSGQAEAEEFPNLTRFWLASPQAAKELTIHALLDGPSVTGAYMFTLRPGSRAGAPTTIDVDATLYPRRDLDKVGIAPLSSMFFYAVGDGSQHPRDYRPEVHDSDGLLIENGKGERLWRPLRNRKALRASAFADTGLKGFGLMQRERSFELYEDLGANYHKRPSAWVEPLNDWGAGAVELFEIPTDSEYHDNIVAQWRPAATLKAGTGHRFAYRISWPDASVGARPVAGVKWSRSGPPVNALTDPNAERFVIEYAVPKLDPAALPTAKVSANNGTISAVTVQQNTETGGVRVSFLYLPAGSDVAELRVELQGRGSDGAETWLYQWSRAKD